MRKSIPLNECKPRKTQTIMNRVHFFTHGAALLALIYYRITSISSLPKTTPVLPHILIFTSELVLSFIWLLSQPSKWKPVSRTAYPHRLPPDHMLPSIDVFVCTADPHKEPSLDVMNTVISAMAMDYPANKLHVYLSDDGGSAVTFCAVKLAWGFARIWIPFCRKYRVENGCPEAYFFREGSRDDVCGDDDDHFLVDKKYVEKAYGDFKISLAKVVTSTSNRVSRDHPPIIEVMEGAEHNKWDSEKDEEMPLLVYVAREKRPSHKHNFKAGALNVLLRVSGMMSNSPYILALDCDMYCNHLKSARQAMCFHLDPNLSPHLGFVQFPQKFHNLSNKDIYDGVIRNAWEKWEGMDGLRGPIVSGTGFYIKREALYGIKKFREGDVSELMKCFGSSKEFIKSVYMKNKPNYGGDNVPHKELQFLASCSYDEDTQWGKKVGFRYLAVLEDLFTSLNLHCEGWKSVYYEPSRPCFLGASPISLGEVLVQHTRWGLGLNQIAFSKFSPILFGSLRMSIFQSMCYAEMTFYPLYFLPLYILALVPSLCLLRAIHIYPQVSSPFFLVFVFLFLSSKAKHVEEVLIMRYPIRTWLNEQRMWMIRSLTSYLYANFNTLMDKIGLIKANFLPTNKAVDEEASKLYEMGIYNYQAPALFMVPLCTLYILNLTSFLVGFARILQAQNGSAMLLEAFIPLFGVVLHFPLLEGMVLRKDKARVSTYVSLLSIMASSIVSTFALFTS